MTDTQPRAVSPEQRAIDELVARKVAGRPGPSYRDILEADGYPIPEYLKLAWQDLGDQNIPIERYISRVRQARGREALAPGLADGLPRGRTSPSPETTSSMTSSTTRS